LTSEVGSLPCEFKMDRRRLSLARPFLIHRAGDFAE
jgi:hypothetical protein